MIRSGNCGAPSSKVLMLSREEGSWMSMEWSWFADIYTGKRKILWTGVGGCPPSEKLK